MKLPLKVRILEYAIEKDEPFTVTDVLNAVSAEYEGERFCNYKFVEKLIRLLLGVGVLKEEHYELAENGELKVEYRITDFGKKYYSKIPGHEK